MPPKAAEGGRNAYAGVVMGSQSGTPVAAQRIWQEHVTKELKFQTIRADYTRNPATVDVLPEKPTDLRRELALRRDAAADEERKQMMETLKQKDPRAHADVVGRLQRAEQDPRDRYAYPQTTSQELGWDLAFAKRHTAESREHTQPHHNGDITAFADKYVGSHGYHPFSTNCFKYEPKAAATRK